MLGEGRVFCQGVRQIILWTRNRRAFCIDGKTQAEGLRMGGVGGFLTPHEDPASAERVSAFYARSA